MSVLIVTVLFCLPFAAWSYMGVVVWTPHPALQPQPQPQPQPLRCYWNDCSPIYGNRQIVEISIDQARLRSSIAEELKIELKNARTQEEIDRIKDRVEEAKRDAQRQLKNERDREAAAVSAKEKAEKDLQSTNEEIRRIRRCA